MTRIPSRAQSMFQVRTDRANHTCPRTSSSLLDAPMSTEAAKVVPSPSDELARIQIYDDLLFACYYNDYILVLRISHSNTLSHEQLISVKYKGNESTLIDSFVVYKNQLWISAGCIVHIFDVNKSKNQSPYNLLMKKPVDDDHLTTMLGFSGYIWAGSLRGNVYVFRMDNYELYKTYAGHHDAVCCLCPMFDAHVASGSGVNDTSIAIWDNVQTAENPVPPIVPKSKPPMIVEKETANLPRQSDVNA